MRTPQLTLLAACLLGLAVPAHAQNKELFETTVRPILRNNATGKCGVCHVPNGLATLKFLTADPSGDYDLIVSLPTVVGTFDKATAPILTSTNPPNANHGLVTYAAGDVDKIGAWLDAEKAARAGSSPSTPPTQPPATTPPETGTPVGPPMVVQEATASENPVRTGSTVLMVVTEGGEGLRYVWTAVGPASVEFTRNGTAEAATTQALFTADGTYDFKVEVKKDSQVMAESQVQVKVELVPDGLEEVTPGAAPSSMEITGHTVGCSAFPATGGSGWILLLSLGLWRRRHAR